MLTKSSKNMRKTRFTKPSKINEGNKIEEKPKTPEALRKLLLPREELKLDDVSLSGSEISDPFADINKDLLLSYANVEKPSSKQEADRLIMAKFTDNFKQTILDTRKELQLGDNMMNESPQDINKILHEQREHKDLPESTQQRIEEILKDSEYMCSTPSQTSDDAPPTRKASTIGFDAMSGVWRMLSVRDAKERFRISSPSFNAFGQEQPHWLDRPAVPWKTLDFSKHKCEKWLNEQHHN